jgi:tRNA(fMet)-specific endonuclease VapC
MNRRLVLCSSVIAAKYEPDRRAGTSGIASAVRDRKRNERALTALLQEIPAVPFDARAAATYGVIRAAVRDRKRHALDRLIAAHAISAGLILVTNDVADFEVYPGLRVENWVE